jgi:hypothetical protein
MLKPQVLVNLLPELGVGVDLVRRPIDLVKDSSVAGTACLIYLVGERALF